jgi:hypothetical protein
MRSTESTARREATERVPRPTAAITPAAPVAEASAAALIEPPPTREATAERQRGLAFSLGSPIALGDPTQSLVTLHSVTFKFTPKNSELQAEVAGYCSKGKDHNVEVQLALVDRDGTTVAVLKGRGDIEEKDQGRIRAKQHLTQSVVASITSFRLTFQAWPD